MKWKCLQCLQTDGVENGFCRKDGPVQTNPVDDEAKKEAGIVVKKGVDKHPKK